MSLIKNVLQSVVVFSTFLLLSFALFSPTLPAFAQAIPGSSVLCGGGDCPLVSNPDSVQGDQNSLANFILGIARFVTYVVGAVSVLAMVFGGFLFVTDSGDGKNAEKGKKILMNAVIGLVVAIVAYTIVGLVGSLVQGNVADQFVSQ